MAKRREKHAFGDMNPNYADDRCRKILEGTERKEAKELARLARVAKTNDEITPERKARKENYIKSKKLELKSAEEIEKQLESNKEELYKKLKDSAQESGVAETMKKFSTDIKNFHEQSKKLCDLRKNTPKKQSFEYNKLLSELALTVDADFILYLDFTNVVDYNTASCITKLDAKNKKKLQIKLEENKMFKNDSLKGFMRVALKNFPDYIDKMEINDACYALGLEPSKFDKLSPQNKDILLSHPSYLKKIITKNNDMLAYLPYDFLDALEKEETNFIGRVIVTNPDVLANFYPAFFDDHYKDIKYMFANLRSVDIINAVSPWVWKFPALGKYFKIEVTNTEQLTV